MPTIPTISTPFTPNVPGDGGTPRIEPGPENRTPGPGAGGGAGDAPPPDDVIVITGSGATQTNPPDDTDASIDALTGALSVLADENSTVEEKLKALMTLVRDPDLLARLMVEFASMERQNALDQRLQARENAAADKMAQADKTRESAEKQLTAALVNMVISIVVAVVSVIAAIGAINSAAKAGAQAKEAASVSKAAKDASDAGEAGASALQETASTLNATSQATTAAATAKNQLMMALANLTKSLGDAVAQVMAARGTMDQADGMEDAARAELQQMLADLEKKIMEDLQAAVEAAIQFLKAIRNAETDLMANMTRL